MTLDLLIHNGYVITMEENGTGIINDGAVGISGNRIAAVGPSDDIMKTYSSHRYIDASGKVVMPGFIDVHTHTSNAIVRGCSQDIDDWMYRGLLPLLSMAETQELVDGSMLNIIEGLKSGTTTFADFDVPMLNMVDNHIKAGSRAVVSEIVNELTDEIMNVFPDVLYPLDPSIGQRKLANNTTLVERYHESCGGRIICRYGPHAADLCSKELLLQLKAEAEKREVDLFIHLAQSQREIWQVSTRYGKTPVCHLQELGYLSEHLVAAHLTHATPEEIRLVAQSGTAMALCSNSNVIISGVLPPAQEFEAAGGLVALGTDQAAGNNCNMMFNEMKVASLIHKYKNGTGTVYPAHKVLRMATADAAKALRLDDKIGSLRPGKLADIIIIDFTYPNLAPVVLEPIRNIIPNLVYSARGAEVETVIIDGKMIVDNHEILTVDEKAIVQQANISAQNIARRVQQQEWSSQLPLTAYTEEGKY